MRLNVSTDQLIFSIILILLGLGQVFQVLHPNNFPAWLILILVGVSYILER
ncbi:MAG: hypothetical protein JNM56_23395 [Planctomycetia bacterium]|nr:hypothetical protein [Planctomycetia bacterium]